MEGCQESSTFNEALFTSVHSSHLAKFLLIRILRYCKANIKQQMSSK